MHCARVFPRYRMYLSRTPANTLCDTPIKALAYVSKHPYISRTFAQSRKSFNFLVPLPTPTTETRRHSTHNTKRSWPITLTENTVCERIQRAALSNPYIVPPFPLFPRRFPELLFFDEESRVTDKPLQLVHDVHGCRSGRLYYTEEA